MVPSERRARPPREQVEIRPPAGADRRPETSKAAAAGVAHRSLAAVNAFDPAGPERHRPAFDRLVLVGDSLADEAAPVIRYLTPQLEFVRRYWGGTAPCDWIDDGLEATPTTVVVISFIGNNSTDCMLAGTGVQPIDETLVDRYRTDVAVLIDQATTAGAWVVLVGQPPRHPRFETDVEVAGINEVYREYAAAMPRVSFVDAGHLVETPDGRLHRPSAVHRAGHRLRPRWDDGGSRRRCALLSRHRRESLHGVVQRSLQVRDGDRLGRQRSRTARLSPCCSWCQTPGATRVARRDYGRGGGTSVVHVEPAASRRLPG